MRQFLISVIIPTYNRSDLFTRAVKSVCLQSFSNTELIVVDDGSTDETRSLVARASQEWDKEIQYIYQENSGAAAARTSSGLASWIQTNISAIGANGAVGGVDTPGILRTNGAQRAFTEAQLKGVAASCWNSGGDPSMIMLGSFNKQKLSGFTGGSTKMTQADDKKLVAAIDIYESDFGSMTVVPNRFSRSRDVFVIQPDMWAVAYLRDFQMIDLAKTGDAEKKAMLAEYTLVAKNEAANGAIFDLTTA